MDAVVSVLRTATYQPELLDEIVEQHFSQLEVEELLHPNIRVVLKPNLLMKRKPEEATTTHPALVAAVARWLQRHGVQNITLADSPGGLYTEAALRGIYQATGMEKAAKETGFALNYTTGWEHRTLADAQVCRSFNLIEPIAQADLIINLPKLKTHAMTQLSGGVKNLFGCVPGLQKPELHFRFPEAEVFCRMVLELSRLVCPQVTLVDAVVAMEGDGPSSGTPRTVGLTLASRQLYALDLALCSLVGLAPTDVHTVSQSIVQGLCPSLLEEVRLVGEPEAFVPFSDFKHPTSRSVDFQGYVPKLLRRPVKAFRQRFLTPRPQIHRGQCIGCGKCAESCPAKVIALRNKKAYISYAKCIKCFCCHEMCPVRAIGIRRAGILDR